jgi:hypothetical protein
MIAITNGNRYELDKKHYVIEYVGGNISSIWGRETKKQIKIACLDSYRGDLGQVDYASAESVMESTCGDSELLTRGELALRIRGGEISPYNLKEFLV